MIILSQLSTILILFLLANGPMYMIGKNLYEPLMFATCLPFHLFCADSFYWRSPSIFHESQ